MHLVYMYSCVLHVCKISEVLGVCTLITQVEVTRNHKALTSSSIRPGFICSHQHSWHLLGRIEAQPCSSDGESFGKTIGVSARPSSAHDVLSLKL